MEKIFVPNYSFDVNNIRLYNNNNGITDLEWKMIYVGSAESEEFDQVLDTIYVGPIPEGRHMFVFQVIVILFAIIILFKVYIIVLFKSTINIYYFRPIHQTLVEFQ